MSNLIRPQPGILEIAPYVGGKAAVAGVTNAVKLSSNENPFGASEKAREAYLRAVTACTATPIPTTPNCARRLPRSTASTLPASSAASAATRSSSFWPKAMPGRATRWSSPNTAS